MAESWEIWVCGCGPTDEHIGWLPDDERPVTCGTCGKEEWRVTVIAAEPVKRFLNVWYEFDGPPLTPQDTFNAVSESVESLRTALDD